MSMRDYAVNDYGLLFDEETMKIISSKIFGDTIIEDDFDLGYELYNEGICEYISDFTGESILLSDDGVDDWGADCEDYKAEPIIYVPIFKYPTLFKKSYDNMEEIIDEFKSRLGEYLPEDFDYRSRIRHISGTYYG